MMERALVFGLLVTACGGATPAPPPTPAPAQRQLQTKLAPLAVGDVFTLSRYRTLDAVVDGQEHHEQLAIERTSRILALVDGEVSKVETSYSGYVQDVRQSGAFESTAPGLAGHTYTIFLERPTRVTREDEAEVTGAELGAVRAANHTPAEWRQDLLATRSWPLSERITLDESQRSRTAPGKSGSATYTLIELTDSHATFDIVAVDRDIPELPGQVLTTRSMMQVDRRTGRLLDEKLSGDFTGAWTGHISEENKWTYTPAAK